MIADTTSASSAGAWSAGCSTGHSARERVPRADPDGHPLVIGLVNNMPDAALRSTERQFHELLAAASSPGVTIHLKLIALPEVPRSDAGQAYVREHYETIGALRADHLDGLIVTGTEPRVPNLQDEPYWPALARLVAWAEDHTLSTVWSCLAAHAAALCLDGIARRRFPAKLSGVFDCERAADHPIVAGAASRWPVPHSRYNGLPEEALVACGYRILTWSAMTGADMATKQGSSLFLFLQGHPEYDRAALLREYRRDIGRFLAEERDSYPDMPQGYFCERATASLTRFRGRVLRDRNPALLAEFPGGIEAMLTHPWHEPAVRLYANWLSYLADQRSRLRGPVATIAAGAHRTFSGAV